MCCSFFNATTYYCYGYRFLLFCSSQFCCLHRHQFLILYFFQCYGWLQCLRKYAQKFSSTQIGSITCKRSIPLLLALFIYFLINYLWACCAVNSYTCMCLKWSANKQVRQKIQCDKKRSFHAVTICLKLWLFPFGQQFYNFSIYDQPHVILTNAYKSVRLAVGSVLLGTWDIYYYLVTRISIFSAP